MENDVAFQSDARKFDIIIIIDLLSNTIELRSPKQVDQHNDCHGSVFLGSKENPIGNLC